MKHCFVVSFQIHCNIRMKCEQLNVIVHCLRSIFTAKRNIEFLFVHLHHTMMDNLTGLVNEFIDKYIG